MSDSESNTFDPPPKKNDREYFTPTFTDGSGNTVGFLYQDFIHPTRERAMLAAIMHMPQIVSLGLKFKETIPIPEDAVMPHVECSATVDGIKYRLAIFSGPEFEKYYDKEKAEETDRNERRAEHAKEQAAELERRHPL